jgi:hypothetical protein
LTWITGQMIATQTWMVSSAQQTACRARSAQGADEHRRECTRRVHDRRSAGGNAGMIRLAG